jgi:hypothetical protein
MFFAREETFGSLILLNFFLAEIHQTFVFDFKGSIFSQLSVEKEPKKKKFKRLA